LTEAEKTVEPILDHPETWARVSPPSVRRTSCPSRVCRMRRQPVAVNGRRSRSSRGGRGWR
jgi:hypothetical protein